MSEFSFVQCKREACGIYFTKRKGSKQLYCCPECQVLDHKVYKALIEKQCDECSNTFHTKLQAQRFCSIQCKRTWERREFEKTLEITTKECAYRECKKPFDGNRKQRYCCAEHATLEKRARDKDRRYGKS